MTYYFQLSVITYLFISSIHTKALQEEQFEMKPDAEKFDFNDLTKGLSDAEIESALSDLTLSDLNVLSKLIDTPNAVDYDYEDESNYANNVGQRDVPPLDDMQIDNNGNANYYDDVDERQFREPRAPRWREIASNPRRSQRTTLRFKIPRDTLSLVEQAENLRPKRENSPAAQQIPIDEEYLKQLENSFPRDQEQKNHEDIDDKKDHVRVKRN